MSAVTERLAADSDDLRSPAMAGPRAAAAAGRIAWIDYAKGWSIILVVTMHSALGVGLAVGGTGWLHDVVAFAKPFRMPDFFLVAGLFAGSAIERPWRSFLDRKVLHFVYFYALWLLIALVAKSGELDIRAPLAFLRAYTYGFIEPFSTMWFIQLLPILFIVTRLCKSLPVTLLLGAAVAMHIVAAFFPDGGVFAMGSVLTGSTTINSFLLYFVYFLSGYLFKDRVFAIAGWVDRYPAKAIIALLVWALAEEIGVRLSLPEIPGLTLVFGAFGAIAVVTLSTLLAKSRLMPWLGYCGRHSLIIYLGFFVPMAVTRLLLIKANVVTDVGWMSFIVAAVAILSPLALNRLLRGTPLGFFFARPLWARLEKPSRRTVLTEAE